MISPFVLNLSNGMGAKCVFLEIIFYGGGGTRGCQRLFCSTCIKFEQLLNFQGKNVVNRGGVIN